MVFVTTVIEWKIYQQKKEVAYLNFLGHSGKEETFQKSLTLLCLHKSFKRPFSCSVPSYKRSQNRSSMVVYVVLSTGLVAWPFWLHFLSLWDGTKTNATIRPFTWCKVTSAAGSLLLAMCNSLNLLLKTIDLHCNVLQFHYWNDSTSCLASLKGI